MNSKPSLFGESQRTKMTSSKWSILSREAIKTLQANGRQASSYSAQFFLLLKFTQVDAPREGEMNYDEKCKSSIVSEFNRVQRDKPAAPQLRGSGFIN